jgi:MoaA/NifB/PqqE/SkfB family radical SAM enzyme
MTLSASILNDFEKYYDKSVEIFQNRTINIDTTHRCLLQCPYCTRQSEWGNGKEFVKTYQAMYGDLKTKDAIDMANTFQSLSFCGQISDPIYHSNFLDVIEAINAGTKIKHIEIHTNGHGKKEEWWEKLLELTNSGNYWVDFVFGIDGIDEKTGYHRVNQSFDSAWNAMKYCAENNKENGNVIWQYIVFEYNENDIPKAIEIANDNGIKFQLLKSSRFNMENSPLAPPKHKAFQNFSGFAERKYITSIEEYYQIINEA